MKDTSEENRALPIIVKVVLLEQRKTGARTARAPLRTCRVTYAPAGRARQLTEWVPTLEDGGVVITWPKGAAAREEVQIHAVRSVREALYHTEAEVVVITNEGQELAPLVFKAVASVLNGRAPEPSPFHFDAIGIDIAATARILLAALKVPAFVEQ